MPVDTVDYAFREATPYSDRRGLFSRLRTPPWDKMFQSSVLAVFSRGGFILDIGGGLRIDPNRCDRLDRGRQKIFGHFLSKPGVEYRVSDYTDQYHPDFVEDIHRLSFADSSVDGLFCLAVLEHVYDPKKAAEEIIRVLKKGGVALIYVPFIYRYHAHAKDYRDYFRYSKDGIAYLFRDCASIEICPVRGLFESLLKFLPLYQWAVFRIAARFLDMAIPTVRRISERQTSGYNIRIVK